MEINCTNKINCTGQDFYEETDFIQQAACKAFGIKYLYPWQRLVIANILDAVNAQEQNLSLEKKLEQGLISKNELDDIIYDQDGNMRARQIVLLPTGAGKSMCFLVPALMLKGATLILYPLLALMNDQERRMNEGGLSSVVFRGGQTLQEREDNFEKIKNGAKIILANPEVLQSTELLERLAKIGIQHIAIDEAHCVSEWGDSFRPAYTTLGNVIKKLGNPVVTAFTATASPKVLQRISQILFDSNAHLVRSDSDRPNIIYNVIKCEAKEKTALEYAEKCEKPLIVFCSTRKRAENLSRTFAEHFGYDKVKFYHAGLERNEKTKIEQWFFPKSDAILCSTCAFGMGVDKKNIKTVIHLDPSPTAESFIQEAGRGGRDGSTAQSYLLWSKENLYNALKYPENSRERVLANFAETTECRRQILLDALGGEKCVCSGCDNCEKRALNYSEDEQLCSDFIRKNNKFYEYNNLEQEIQKMLNQLREKKGLQRIWEFKDAGIILTSLFAQNKIYTCNFPWKNKIGMKKKIQN
ncbi:MAG: RecQ family ATP-dependent DNA helicase [Treponemataceae bacterium]